jgi:glycosyltransferase involved in cell wall biosynthesis
MPLVTVLMPAYNSAKYIGEAIESILNQSFTDFELLIIDDKSTDNTLATAEHYAEKDKRIRILANEVNLGQGITLNKGINAGDSKYFARMDSDDLCTTNRLAKLIEKMESSPEIAILGSWLSIFPEHKICKSPVKNDEAILCEFIRSMPVFGPTQIFRRELMVKHNLSFKPIRYAEDYTLLVDALLAGLKIDNLPEVLYLYRQHPNQTIATNMYDCFQNAYKATCRLLEKIGFRPDPTEVMTHNCIFKYILLIEEFNKDPSILLKMKNYIEALIDHNTAYKFFPEQLFNTMILESWFIGLNCLPKLNRSIYNRYYHAFKYRKTAPISFTAKLKFWIKCHLPIV